MFDQFESILASVRLFILGQSILFVVLMGLLISILSVAGEVITYWIARLGGPALIARLTSKGWMRMNPRRLQRTEVLFSR